jgi:acetoin utilization deacetylase AcuC-like enzyme
MLVLFANDYLLHNPKFEYYDGTETPYAEQVDRITNIIETCKKLRYPMREVTSLPNEADVTALHTPHYVDYFRNKCADIPEGTQLTSSVFIKDTYTPLVKHTFQAAMKSAGIALEAADELLNQNEKIVYALCRPPGHHAEHDAMMGYCYFNNAALAAHKLAQTGKKVAILDIDYHHGNGTQEAFYERSDVLYVSIHADPAKAFPYGTGYKDEQGKSEGKGYTRNLPLPLSTTPTEYLAALDEAIAAINDYQPDYFVLSLGFDTYENDPIGNLGIDEDSYMTIAAKIAKSLAYPTLIVQEGGYNVEKLGTLAEKFLSSYETNF